MSEGGRRIEREGAEGGSPVLPVLAGRKERPSLQL